MAVTTSPASAVFEDKGEEAVEKKKNRSKCPGVRVVGGRIYDPQNGKTCHQCRQKTMDFAAACTNLKRNKQCTLKFCHKCLLNRYGEKAEDVALLDNWQCPKCKDICNCSFCMKKKGHKPTGILVHTAKENGFSSVSELLQVKGSENLSQYKTVKDICVSPKKTASLKKECTVASTRKPGKENSFDGNVDLNFNSQNSVPISSEKKSKKTKREGLKEVSNGNGDGESSLKGSGRKKTKREGVKEAGNDNGDGEASIKESGRKKKKREGVKEGNDNGDSEASIKESGRKKPRISEAVFRNGVKTNEKDDTVFVNEKNSMTESKDLPKKGGMKKKNDNIFEKKNKSDVQPQENFKKKLKTNKKNNGTVCCIRDNKTQIEIKTVVDSCETNKCSPELQNKEIDAEIPVPMGTCLTAIAGIELPPEDVGNALQFLEFCASFGKVLDMKKGQPEAVLGEIINGRRGRRSQSYLLSHIHIQLLSVIEKDPEEESPTLNAINDNSWLQALGKYVSNSLISKELSSDCFDSGSEGYEKLNSSEKLRLLNFLCDEALNTKDLRSWIDDQHSKLLERQKEAKEKVFVAKEKERNLKKKMLGEVAKVIIEKNGAPVSVSDHKSLVSQIKTEAAQAHAEMMEAMSMLPKERQRSDAVRTDPILLDVNGHAFWKLNGYNGQSDILLQDMSSWDSVAPSEQWLVYANEEKQEIEKYISSIRTKRLRVQKATETPANEIDETNL